MTVISLRFNTVWVIESLQPGDLRTGTELRDAVLGPFQVDGALRAILSRPITKADLFAVLQQVLTECRGGGVGPILHFDVHGDRNGLQLTSGESIAWNELKPILTEINVATRFNLLVVLAACEGAHMISILNILDRAPVWGLVAPMEPVPAGALLRDFAAFYSTLVPALDGAEAVRALNASAGSRRRDYVFMSAAEMFRGVFEHYMATATTEADLKEREDDIVRTAEQLGGSREKLGAFREHVHQALRDHKGSFRPFAERFFMYDLLPESAKRFPIDGLT